MQILRHYPFSILTVLAIWYLSFFTPPHTQLEEINNFDDFSNGHNNLSVCGSY
jgi:hypothetical protein